MKKAAFFSGPRVGDDPKAAAAELKARFGVDEDYFSAAPPAVTPELEDRLDIFFFTELIPEANSTWGR